MTRPRVGIVGAGQLGRMLALAGYPLGIDCTLLDTSPDAPGAQVAALVLGALDDPAALAKLAERVDVVTLEIENVAVAALESLHGRIDVFPPPAAVAAAQDRLAEKTLFRSLGIPTARVRHDRLGEPTPRGRRARLARDREDAPHGLRRPRPTRRRLARGARRGLARARQRAVDRRGIREVRARGVADRACREHATSARSIRSPRTCIATAFSRAPSRLMTTQALQRQAERWLEAIMSEARVPRRVDGRVLSHEERARRQRDGAARPQLRPLDHRGRRDEPVRESPARRARLAARRCDARAATRPC